MIIFALVPFSECYSTAGAGVRTMETFLISLFTETQTLTRGNTFTKHSSIYLLWGRSSAKNHQKILVTNVHLCLFGLMFVTMGWLALTTNHWHQYESVREKSKMMSGRQQQWWTKSHWWPTLYWSLAWAALLPSYPRCPVHHLLGFKPMTAYTVP